MPIYEYECRKCQAHTEVFQKVSDKPLVKCRKCGGRLDKILSAPAIHFKGSGWYVTDYSKKSGTKHEAEASSTTSKKTDDKSKETSPKTPSDKTSSPKTSSGD